MIIHVCDESAGYVSDGTLAVYILSNHEFSFISTVMDNAAVYKVFVILDKLGICHWKEFICYAKPLPVDKCLRYEKDYNIIRVYEDEIVVIPNWKFKSMRAAAYKVADSYPTSIPQLIPNILNYHFKTDNGDITPNTIATEYKSISNYRIDSLIRKYKYCNNEHLAIMYQKHDSQYLKLFEEALIWYFMDMI